MGKNRKDKAVGKPGAVELDEKALDDVTGGGETVGKIPLPPAPFVATPFPTPSTSGAAETLLGHELTHVYQGDGTASKGKG